MSAPPMIPENVLARIEREVSRLAAELARVSTSVSTWQNATVDSGGITVKNGGGIRLLGGGSLISEDGYVRSVNTEVNGGAQLQDGDLFFLPDLNDLARFGYVRVLPGEDAGNNMWIRPPQAAGTSGSPTRMVLRGPGGGMVGGAWLQTDGTATINAQGMLFLTADQIQLNATGSNGISMFGTPTTSSAANMFLGTVGGQWQVARSTSSRRYKQDIEAHEVDVEGVKAWQRSRWVDIYDAEHVEVPFAPREHVGFIAEQVHEHTPEFVVCDGEGEPDALEYDRMAAVGLHAWCERLQGEVDDLTAERDAQAQQIAALIDANTALAHRLDALEADRG